LAGTTRRAVAPGRLSPARYFPFAHDHELAFEGAPSLPFDTANGGRYRARRSRMMSWMRTPEAQPARKYYQNYQRTHGANDDMLHAPQGLHAFFRAYYFYKSADYKGTSPSLKGANGPGDGANPDLLRDGERQGHGGHRCAFMPQRTTSQIAGG